MKKYDLYSKGDPAKNFSPLPNEVFYLDLSYGAIAIYGYLMHIEDRKTFQSYASYNTIGRAVKMSANTVRKYVLELEDKCLIRTEPTTVVTRDGRKRNGTLRYYIRPIREAVDHYHERQLSQLELAVERQKAQARLSQLCAAQEPPLPAGHPTTPPTVERGVSGLCGPVCRVGGLNDLPNGQMNRGAKKVQDKGVAPCAATPGHTGPQCGPGEGKRRSLEPFAVHFKKNCANRRMASISPAWHWIWH